jgi:hypothetical protein
MRMQFGAGVALMATMMVFPAIAQEKPPAVAKTVDMTPTAHRVRPTPIPLKVTVTLSRHRGDKRLSSMPYVLGVTATVDGSAPKTTLRMGVDVPLAKQSALDVNNVSYRSVGTNIDCEASFNAESPDLFQLVVIVSDSSLGLDTGEKRAGLAPDMPAFRKFNSSFTAMLRDGR